MNDETLLLRQVNPAWVQEGHITSQAFRPTPKDKKQLSVYDGNLITAENAWRHFTHTLGHSSIGVMAVTVSECEGQELTVRPDPEPFPEHAVIDFGEFAENQIKTKAKHLKVAAELRGWLFNPTGSDSRN